MEICTLLQSFLIKGYSKVGNTMYLYHPLLSLMNGISIGMEWINVTVRVTYMLRIDTLYQQILWLGL